MLPKVLCSKTSIGCANPPTFASAPFSWIVVIPIPHTPGKELQIFGGGPEGCPTEKVTIPAEPYASPCRRVQVSRMGRSEHAVRAIRFSQNHKHTPQHKGARAAQIRPH